jgi:pyruvate-formate lyase-activating enzyme
MLIDHWSHGSPIRWNFGGGEPTMHPRFMDILKYLKSRNQWVLVTTNGSRSTKFWREASQYINSVNMSAHFASMDLYSGNEDRFVEVCKVIMEHHDAVDDDHWIEIKLMTPPGFLERAQSTRQRILDLEMLDKPGANLRPKGTISLVPIRDLNDAEKLVDYSENEIKYFTNQ